MSVMCFGSPKELEAAELRKLGPTIWNCKSGKAYIYAALSSRWRAKIGAATSPIGRIREIANYWGDVQQIYVTQPRKDWRATELALIAAMEGYQIRGWMCSESSREWFKLPKLAYAALRECFLNNCTTEAITNLRGAAQGTSIPIHPMKTTIGTCSICGGQVCVPHIWMSVNPPVPQCAQCGAVAANHGPVIPMKPMTVQYNTTKVWKLTGNAPEVEMPA